MKILTIALNTFKEAIRDRILYLILFVSIFFIVFSRVLSMMTVGDELKVIKDVGLASISIFGVFMAIIIGTNLVYKEIDKRTIYTLLSKPIHRYEFLLGKFLGLNITLLVMVVIMSVVFFGLMFLYGSKFESKFLIAILLIFMELAVITAISILFSSFTTPILSSVFTFFLYLIGHFSQNFKFFIAKTKAPIGKLLIRVLYYILPNLEKFNIKTEVVHNLPLSSNFILYSLLYGIFYVLAVLFLSALIFHKRDFI